MLLGRSGELSAIAALLNSAGASRSGVLLMHGAPGVGKSALLAHAVAEASDMRVLRATGVEREAHLPFAALHQLLRPVLGDLPDLPQPQADALRIAFGLRDGTGQQPFLVSVAVLGLIAEAAEHRPLLCVVDDAQWLDDASANALVFVARRLAVEPVALLLAARDEELRRLAPSEIPTLLVRGLPPEAAQELLRRRAGVSVPATVSARLVEATEGNPLALVELATVLTRDQLSGRAPLPHPLPLTDGVEHAFLNRVHRLPVDVQRMLLVAAADDTARIGVVLAAAARLDAPGSALDAAEAAELIRVGAGELTFRHPLIRSAVYQGAADTDRRGVHRALAEVMDLYADDDRRAWHRALATVEPDDGVVRELEQAALRARARGGLEVACTAWARAAELTAVPQERARLLVNAAETAWLAGLLDRATDLLHAARRDATDPVLVADVDRLRAWIELSTGSPATARYLLVRAAQDVASFDRGRGVEMLVDAAEAAWVTGDTAVGAHLRQLSTGVPRGSQGRDRFFGHLLDGFVGLLNGEFGRPVRALLDAMAVAQKLGHPELLMRAGHTAFYLGDDDVAYRLNAEAVARARATGAIGELLFALHRLTLAELLTGRWVAAEASASEAVRLTRETGRPALAALPQALLAVLAALRGDLDRFRDLLTATEATAGTHALGVLQPQVDDALRWARGLHELAGGRVRAASPIMSAMSHPALAGMAAALDRIEVAVQAGHREDALTWLATLDAFASHAQCASSQARVAHCRALLAEGHTAQELFEEALALHTRSTRPFEEARTQLAYGQFLRRAKHRVAARTHLEAALDTFERLGAAPWAERARSELRASGQTALPRTDPSSVNRLTPQEIQVARFVARGLPTREVAAQLFLSPRTVDFHLRNVFTKLGISSRTELAHVPLD
jgi:DNA-binding CsgD family transcriptional regulator